MKEHKDTSRPEVVLRFSCADQPGIVASVASFFCGQGFNIRESSQFEDRDSRQFFMRTVFERVHADGPDLKQLQASFRPIAESYGMDWQLRDYAYRPRVLIAVSKWGHCLNTLLNSWKLGSLPVEIVGVVSNHEVMRPMVEWYGLTHHYLPVEPGSKHQQEAKLLELFASSAADLLVLARYMQILSDEACVALAGKAINIHHSFLPGFKGARPYHQAYARGVKLIGATAHYVTSDLDEGPIIEQAVERVSHANTPEQLVEIGRDIEAVVLQRAVHWHAEHRVLVNRNKTVVFRP
jgi:formyltetrahydrofolate deformylase